MVDYPLGIPHTERLKIISCLVIGSLLVYHASLEDSTLCDKSAALRFVQLR